MLGVFTYYPDDAVSLDNLAIAANLFYGCPDLHVKTPDGSFCDLTDDVPVIAVNPHLVP